MKRLISILLFALPLLSADPHLTPINKGWLRHAFKMGSVVVSLETPAECSENQEGDPILMEAVDLGGKPLRQLGEPVTTGVGLFQALFDVKGLPWQGMLSSVQVVVFLGQLAPGESAFDSTAFHYVLTNEYRAFLEAGNAQAKARGAEPRFRILQDFTPVSIGTLPTLRVRFIQDGVEGLHHFLPLNTSNYLVVSCRFLEGSRAKTRHREADLDRARAIGEKVVASLFKTPNSIFKN